jgi:hypothetical protein
MVIWWLLGAFAVSALAGFGVWILLRRVRRRWVRISSSVVSGTFIFVVAGAAFVLLGFAPASDEFHSYGRTFTIYVTTPGAWESWKGSERRELPSEDRGVRFTDGGLVPDEKFFDNLSVQKWPGTTVGSIAVNVPKLFQRIRISLAESVSQRQDFSISIAIDRFGSACAAGEQQFLLLTESGLHFDCSVGTRPHERVRRPRRSVVCTLVSYSPSLPHRSTDSNGAGKSP